MGQGGTELPLLSMAQLLLHEAMQQMSYFEIPG